MNIEEAKNIRLADYLQSLGYHPVKPDVRPYRAQSDTSQCRFHTHIS